MKINGKIYLYTHILKFRSKVFVQPDIKRNVIWICF